MPDPAHGVSAWTTPDARAYGVHRQAHGAGYTSTGLLHAVAPRKRLDHSSNNEDSRIRSIHLVVDSTGLNIFGEGGVTCPEA